MPVSTTEIVLLKTDETADRLGVSMKVLWAYVEAGLLVPVAPRGRGRGKRVFFDSDEVTAFVKGGADAAAAYRQKQKGLDTPVLTGPKKRKAVAS